MKRMFFDLFGMWSVCKTTLLICWIVSTV